MALSLMQVKFMVLATFKAVAVVIGLNQGQMDSGFGTDSLPQLKASKPAKYISSAYQIMDQNDGRWD